MRRGGADTYIIGLVRTRMHARKPKSCPCFTPWTAHRRRWQEGWVVGAHATSAQKAPGSPASPPPPRIAQTAAAQESIINHHNTIIQPFLYATLPRQVPSQTSSVASRMFGRLKMGSDRMTLEDAGLTLSTFLKTLKRQGAKVGLNVQVNGHGRR